MHISDLHADLYYTAGAPMKCSEPVCCRSNVTNKIEFKDILNRIVSKEYIETDELSDGPAGYWGSLSNCDLPFQTFDLFTKEL